MAARHKVVTYLLCHLSHQQETVFERASPFQTFSLRSFPDGQVKVWQTSLSASLVIFSFRLNPELLEVSQENIQVSVCFTGTVQHLDQMRCSEPCVFYLCIQLLLQNLLLQKIYIAKYKQILSFIFFSYIKQLLSISRVKDRLLERELGRLNSGLKS